MGTTTRVRTSGPGDGFDATFRYRSLRRAIYKRFARTELFWSDREQPIANASAFGAYSNSLIRNTEPP